jgi:Ribbon-helix-helix domain
MTQESIRIDSDIVKQLREYSSKTHVPISKVIEEAVGEWLTCVAPVRLERLGLEPLAPAFKTQSIGYGKAPIPISPDAKDASGKDWYETMEAAGKPVRKPKK